MTLREQVHEAVRSGDLPRIASLVADHVRALRHLVGMAYRPEPELAETAARGVALGARHHPEHVQKIVGRLVWAMNDESGTNALTAAPVVIQAVAEESPELLLPMVPDLLRLTADEGLREGLAQALRTIAASCPDTMSAQLSRAINHAHRTPDGEES